MLLDLKEHWEIYCQVGTKQNNGDCQTDYGWGTGKKVSPCRLWMREDETAPCFHFCPAFSRKSFYPLFIFNDSEGAAQNKALWLIFPSCFYSQVPFISFSKIYLTACNMGRQNEVVRFIGEKQEDHSSNVLH